MLLQADASVKIEDKYGCIPLDYVPPQRKDIMIQLCLANSIAGLATIRHLYRNLHLIKKSVQITILCTAI